MHKDVNTIEDTKTYNGHFYNALLSFGCFFDSTPNFVWNFYVVKNLIFRQKKTSAFLSVAEVVLPN